MITYKVVAEKKFGFKKLLEKLGRKGTPEQNREIEALADKLPKDLKVVVGRADEELLNAESAVVEIGGYNGEALKKAMDTYNEKYGRLPKEIYTMDIGETARYLLAMMDGFEKKGINTRTEIEAAIKERRSFGGPHAKGVNEDGYYRVYVEGDLIYDGKENAFDCDRRKSAIYSDIQRMIADYIYSKGLAAIKKERKSTKKTRERS